MFTALLTALSNMFWMALHVIHTGSFPQPLSAEEERACFEDFRKRGDTAARNRLVEHNLRLVAHVVKKYYSNTPDRDDLISIGTIGLIKAVDTFDFERGARLATYASRCIENEILMHFRAGRKSEREIPLSEPIDTDSEGNPLTLMDVCAVEDTIADDLDLKVRTKQLYQYIAQALTPRERQIVQWRYGLTGDALPQRTVAKMLGISRSYVSRIEKKALGKLRRCFETNRKINP